MTTRPTPARAQLARIAVAACAAIAFVLGAGAGAAHAGPARMDGGERAVLHRLNAIRHAHGLRGLRASRRLARAADAHSAEMMRHHYLGHASADGSPWDRRIRRYVRARALGETVAVLSRRSRMASAVVRQWMNSPPHRATLLSRSFRRIGVARRAGRWGGSRVAFFTADLASRR
jgi:uncharacterized protein YkwD